MLKPSNFVKVQVSAPVSCAAKVRPALGKIGQLEKNKAELIHVICHKNLVKKVIAEVKKVHPYEEPAVDIIPRYDIV